MNQRELTGRLPEPDQPRSMHEPVSPEDDPAIARSNMILALVLWAVSFALFAGTVAVASIYLALD